MGAAARARVGRDHDLAGGRVAARAILAGSDETGRVTAIHDGAGEACSVLFWVQHLLGIGHLQRTLRIADALVGRGIAVTVVSGGMPQSLRRDPAVALVQLPPLRARDASFALIDEPARRSTSGCASSGGMRYSRSLPRPGPMR